MKNDEVYEQAFLRHSTFLVHYSIFLFGCGFAAVRTGMLFFINRFHDGDQEKICLSCF
jgi:hypothetical protein